MSFLNSLTSNSNKFDKPFPHWELNNPLSEEAINEIIIADIANPNDVFFESVDIFNTRSFFICDLPQPGL